MAQHAILSASGSDRWINCPGSPAAERDAVADSRVIDLSADDEAAAEGTLGHLVMTLKARELIEHYDAYEELTAAYKHELWSEDLGEAVDQVIDRLISIYNTPAGERPIVYLDTKVDYSHLVPHGFGTLDVAFYWQKRRLLRIFDAKFGRMFVGAIGNYQMRCYAGGLLPMLPGPVDEIEMQIGQPRLNNWGIDVITPTGLQQWFRDVATPAGERAWAMYMGELEPEFRPGDHCHFCKARATCRARKEHAMVVARNDFAMPAPAQMSVGEIAQLLPQVLLFQKWSEDVLEHARARALDGVVIPGAKLVAGRTKRYVTDAAQALQLLEMYGYDPAEFTQPTKLVGITEIEKRLGKAGLKQILGDVIGKPNGKPTLVLESDPRPEIVPKLSAIEDFNDETE